MKPYQIVSTAILFLLFGGGAPALAAQEQHEEKAAPAQHEQETAPAQHEEAKPPQREPEARPAQHPEAVKPQQHAPEAKPPQHEEARPPQHEPAQRPEAAKPPQHEQEVRPVPGRSTEAAPARQEPNHAQPQINAEQRRAQQTAWNQHRAQHWQSEHRNWRERGGYHGYRIPEQRFVAYFGPAHVFPIYTVPIVVVGGYPRFQYEGFWFTVVDPWPEYWADDWFYTDDVYVVYQDDGYYLCNQRYPGVMLAVEVSA